MDKTDPKSGLNTQDSARPTSHSPVVLVDSNYYDARETQTNSPQDTPITDSRNILTSQDGTVRFFGGFLQDERVARRTEHEIRSIFWIWNPFPFGNQ